MNWYVSYQMLMNQLVLLNIDIKDHHFAIQVVYPLITNASEPYHILVSAGSDFFVNSPDFLKGKSGTDIFCFYDITLPS